MTMRIVLMTLCVSLAASAAYIMRNPDGSADLCPGVALSRANVGCQHLATYGTSGTTDAGTWACDQDGGCVALDGGQ